MKHFWALSSTLLLSLALVVAGVVSWAGEKATPEAADPDRGDLTGFAAAATPAEHGLFWQLAAPQEVVAGVHLIPRDEARRGSQGTRSDREFFEISSTGGNDVPDAALRAYRRAEKVMAAQDPDCQIPWTLLAAIGRVESNHGRFAGSQLGSDGVSRPEIRGPRLDGAGPFAAIADSDGGTLDRDVLWDRAVGPMQFLPETWSSVARDADGDGRMNPDDLDDAALGSAVYLCGVGGSLADPAGAGRAAFRYNPSDYYVQLVLAMQAGYETGVFAEPTPPPPPAKPSKAAKARGGAKPGPVKPRSVKPGKPGKPAVKPSSPNPSPQPAPQPGAAPKPGAGSPPEPTPKPTPAPKREQLSGTWTRCSGFCVSGTTLDLGPMGGIDDPATADFDRNGTRESNRKEFAGLEGQSVVLEVERTPQGTKVYRIEAQGPRPAPKSSTPSARASAPPSAKASAPPSARASAPPSARTTERSSPTPTTSPTTSAP